MSYKIGGKDIKMHSMVVIFNGINSITQTILK